MAVGTAKKATAYEYNKGLGAYNNNTNTFAYSLVSDTYASIDQDAVTLNMSSVTVIASAGAYVSGTAIANTSWAQSGSRVFLDGDDFSITADASNPATARCLVIYNDTSAADDIYCIVDLTSDGSTAATLTAGMNYTINANGVAEVALNV